MQTPRPMSKKRMDQSWQRMKDQILSTWEAVPEDELKKARGNLGQMVTLIETQTGEDRTVIMSKMSAFV